MVHVQTAEDDRTRMASLRHDAHIDGSKHAKVGPNGEWATKCEEGGLLRF